MEREKNTIIKNEADIIRFKKPQHRVPKYLYKYFNNLNYAKEFLEKNELHFEKLTDYNDVFDGATSFDLKDFYRWGYCKEYQKRFFSVIDGKERDKIIDISDTIRDYAIRLDEYFDLLANNGVDANAIKQLQDCLIKDFTNLKPINIKCTCFSETCNSELMWATYGGRLKGACLIFDTSMDPNLFEHAQKVIYTNYRSNKDINDFFTKSMCWSYEQEWRIVFDESSKTIEDHKKELEYIHTNACVGLIIGEKMSQYANDECPIGSVLLKKLAKNTGLKIKIANSDRYEYKININDEE